MPHVVVVGSLNMDLVVSVPRMPAAGETIFGNDFQIFPGGKGANQAVAAARLGARVTMIGRVGQDAFGDRLIAQLRSDGVDVTRVAADPKNATGVAMIALEKSGQNSIIVASGANMCLTPEEVALAWRTLEDIDVLIMPLEVPVECIEEASRLAKNSGARVVLNPAPVHPFPDDLLGRVDVLVPNESETTLLTKMPVNTKAQAEEAARSLQARGAKAIVLTLGERGALLLDQDSPARYFPAHPVEVVDTTGAGDAFVAALAVGLAEGGSLIEAVRLANATGALTVTKKGAQPAIPNRKEVNHLLMQPGGEFEKIGVD